MVWGKDPPLFVAYVYTVIPPPFIEKTILSSIKLSLCQKLIDPEI